MQDAENAKLIDYLFGQVLAHAAALEALCEVIPADARTRAAALLRVHCDRQRNFAEPRPVSEEYLQGLADGEAQFLKALDRDA